MSILVIIKSSHPSPFWSPIYMTDSAQYKPFVLKISVSKYWALISVVRTTKRNNPDIGTNRGIECFRLNIEYTHMKIVLVDQKINI